MRQSNVPARIVWVVSWIIGSAAICSSAVPPSVRPFDDGWRFFRGDVPGAEARQFDDSTWRLVDTPHDWSIEDLPPSIQADTAYRLDLSRGRWLFKPGDDPNWSDPCLDDSGWAEVHTPANWEEHGQSNQDNVYGWFRRRFEVPESAKGKDLFIELGSIDDCDQTFVNGHLVGGLGSFPPNYASAWDQQRSYLVPAAVLNAQGDNLVAVRVFDAGGEGGLNGPATPAIRVGPFDSRASEGKSSTGWVVGGTGWYRKRFAVEPTAQRVEAIFEGIYMDADVWLNGQHVGNHPYGYTSFCLDLTPFLDRQGANCLAVRVRNEGRNSRWYSGSGIYRHVWLRTTGLVYIPTWGLFVTTPQVSKDLALVVGQIELANADNTQAAATVELAISDPAGRTVAKGRAQATIPAGRQEVMRIDCHIKRPQLWGPSSPAIYKAVAQVFVSGRLVDRYQTSFGIRTIQVDAQKGLLINGEPVELRGGCMHHDNGILGAAAIDRAEYRRVELMKAAGFNAIRTSHNPPSPAFLDACDRLGMLVMDEAFDQWQVQKNPQDYHRFFGDWWREDIASMVRRDRNHPSVIMWSIGNEIVERAEPSAVELARQLVAAVKALDPTRPVTEAVNAPGRRPWSSMDLHFEQLDVCGYNYLWQQYQRDHQRLPGRVMVGTESFPMEAFVNWQQVLRHPFVIGDFVWTGFDYLGESGIGRSWIAGRDPGGFTAGWPWHIAGCGDIDILGRRKPQSFYRQALWEPGILYVAVRRPLEPGQVERVSRWGWPDMASHWTWPGWEGKTLRLEVYSSCQQVKLLLNGKELASKPTGWENRCKAEFDVQYAPGELLAVGTYGDKQVKFVLRTADKPKRLILKPDRSRISAGRNDLCFVDIEIVDAKGIVVPYADIPVTVEVDGQGELAAIGNANPVDMDSFKGPTRRAWQGRLQAIVRPKGIPGTIRLVASADGLQPASTNIQAR